MAYCTHVWSRRGIRERQQEKLGQDENMFIDPRSPTKRKKTKDHMRAQQHQLKSTDREKPPPAVRGIRIMAGQRLHWRWLTSGETDSRKNTLKPRDFICDFYLQI